MLQPDLLRLERRLTEETIRANQLSESHQRALRERDGHRMSADRAHGELHRVREALGIGPGGPDLGLQVRDLMRTVEQLQILAAEHNTNSSKENR